MDATLDYLHDIVDGLDEQDRQNLAGILAHKSEAPRRGTPRSSPPTPHAYVWSALCDVLGPERRIDGLTREQWATNDRGMGIERGRFGAGQFDAALEQVHEYVIGCSRDPLGMSQRMALARVALGCLFRYLKKRRVPDGNGMVPYLEKGATSKMLHNVHRLADAVDDDYPGYASAGLLGIVLTARAA
jgi:hypothetical protein